MVQGPQGQRQTRNEVEQLCRTTLLLNKVAWAMSIFHWQTIAEQI